MEARYGWRRLQNHGYVSAAVLIMGTVIALVLCFFLLSSFLSALTWSVGLAVLAYPLYQRILKHLKSPNLAASLTVLFVSICLIVPVILVGHQVLQQMMAAVTFVNNVMSVEQWESAVETHAYLRRVLHWAQENIDIQGQIQRLSEAMAKSAPSLLKGSAGAMADLLITLLTLFFFLRDKDAILRLIRELLPLPDWEIKEILIGVHETIQGIFKGTIALAAVQGLSVGLTFWWLSLPGPLLWGFVMGALAFVPFLGVIGVWIPAALFLAFQGEWAKGLVLAACGTLVIGFLHNLLYPMFVGKELRFHTLVVFFAVVGGMLLFGASGMLLGPIILSIAWSLLKICRRRMGQSSIENHGQARLAR